MPAAEIGPIRAQLKCLALFQIEPEERVLEEHFGEEFDAYRRTVRRWI